MMFITLFEDSLNYRQELRQEKEKSLIVAGYKQGWRGDNIDYKALYSNLVLYSGKLKGFATATIIPCDEVKDNETTSVLDPLQFTKLDYIL